MRESVLETPFADLEFVIGVVVPPETRRPAVAVDGPVCGVDFSFDHHTTGHAVNLDAIPDQVVMPGTIVTTMVDTDAVLSVAVVLLRAAGEHEQVDSVWPVLYEAAYICSRAESTPRLSGTGWASTAG